MTLYRAAILSISLASALGALGCSSGSPTDSAPPTCEPSDPNCRVFTHTYSTLEIKPGEEIASLCQSYTLNNPDEIWVNSVELDNGGAYHHSNWFFVPNTKYTNVDGTWDCTAGGFDEVGAALAGGVLFAQSTQSTHEVQQFPEGVAVRIPPWSRIVGSTHLLNASSAPVDTTLTVSVTSIPAADVTVKLTPFRLEYHDLAIPPGTKSQFTSSCDFKTIYENAKKSPFALKVYYVLPHYHKLGTRFLVQKYDGTGSTTLDELDGFNGEAHGKAFDPPVDMSDSKGFTFSCEYMNPTTQEIVWGLGGEEMCEMLGFADVSLAFDATVGGGTTSVNQVGATVDGVVQNTGPCSVVGLPWSYDKPGGKAPTK